MLGKLFKFILEGIIKCINMTKTFSLDNNKGITFFHFLLFLIFARIVIYIIEYIKKIEITAGENENEYKKEKRFKK